MTDAMKIEPVGQRYKFAFPVYPSSNDWQYGKPSGLFGPYVVEELYGQNAMDRIKELQKTTILRAKNTGRYLAEVNDGRLLYLNHAGAWQECPNFISGNRDRIKELEAKNETAAKDLAWMIENRNKWQCAATSRNSELEETKAKLAEAIKALEPFANDITIKRTEKLNREGIANFGRAACLSVGTVYGALLDARRALIEKDAP